MKKLHILARASLLISAFSLLSYAGDDKYVVRVHPSIADAITKQAGGKIEKALKNDEGVYLVTASTAAAQALQSNPLVQSFQKSTNLVLPELSGASIKKPKSVRMYGGTPKLNTLPTGFRSYINQPTVAITQIGEAQRAYGAGNRSVKVAIIDTGVDPTHPALVGALYLQDATSTVDDQNTFNVNQETTPFVDQETTPFVDQETTPFVDGMGAMVLNQETTPFVDQETTPFVDQETTPFVDNKAATAAKGHGTAVASLVRLVAPNVWIVPIRAFKMDGSGTLADVIQAIYWAVEHHVDVISMSFSTTDVPSAELKAAIKYATDRNIICVASAGNGGSNTAVYPAAMEKVISVGATTDTDDRASFSNYGSTLDLAAPGVWIWAAWPSNHWAAVTGTSFSTPLVAGTAALIRSQQKGESPDQADSDLSNGAKQLPSSLQLGAGRLNVLNSVKAANQ
jgi:subtilisin family serine protease